MDAVTVERWSDQFTRLWDQIAGCFGRCDLQARAQAYVRGLLGPVQRKNSWQVAEHVGDAKPYGLQRLLGRAKWDAEAVRDEVRAYAKAHLPAKDEAGFLIVNETGFLKKGEKSVGVQRQYSGTAGRIENCQIGVFLALCGSRGRALIDRALYLPKGWCQDRVRLREAGVPTSVHFATKPQLAQAMIGRALDAGLRPRWVLADEVYGSDGKTRRFLESRGQPYVVAVSSQQRLWVDFKQQRVDRIAEQIPDRQWHRMSIAEGAKRPRVYDWAAGRFGVPTPTGLSRWVLIRRRVDDPCERAYYLCAAPPDATIADLAIAAGQRWSIETCFETAKQEVGLDEYEVRSWTGWHRHITLSMLALAFLAAVRAEANESGKKGELRWSH
ncbi:MAG: IS701 family transposase [Planctomycetes bacterium]|nr:IS701 family transposase [Planctomycetota bacterium]NOG54947.1 IS701 family transposase [Planctomycetota bacterium]